MDITPVDKPATSSETHFRFYYFAAIVGLVRQAVGAFDSFSAVVERFPFLTGYANELARLGLEGADITDAPKLWRGIVESWEAAVPDRLPLRALARGANLDYSDIVALVGAALVDEDMRFGTLFAALHGMTNDPRPTMGMIAQWIESDDAGRPPLLRTKRLVELGLLEITNPEAPTSACCVRVPSPLAMALHGHAPELLGPGLRYCAPDTLPQLDDLVLSPLMRQNIERLKHLIARGEITTLVVRGPHANGRHALVSALARSGNHGVLAADPVHQKALSVLGPLAALFNAVPTIELDSTPGEAIAVPALSCHTGWRALVLGARGGYTGIDGEKSVVVKLELPDLSMRKRLWERAVPSLPATTINEIAERFRMTSGTIVQLAGAAVTQSKLVGRDVPSVRDFALARATLDRGALDVLATHTPCTGDWDRIVTSEHTWLELRVLEQRCRHREHLTALAGDSVAGGAGCGVRALLKGPSGTGKTLAARLLASALDMDLYRVDLSTVVNKYIGETEKHLSSLFDRAEELDAILLFDEGDALFGRRTDVQTSTDRYANLETNFLLQRIESHEGIVLITTNRADAIDSAFQRRLDIVVDFGLPDAEQRLALWGLHLPRDHQVPGDFLEDAAQRCTLTGGQIRNTATHATLLALAAAAPVRLEHAVAALHREYRKVGAICPLRSSVVYA